jgi:hypothetical protein
VPSLARSMVAPLLAISLLVTAAVGVVQAKAPTPSDLPARIELPNGFQPEGVVSWGSNLYAGSVANGAIWSGSARTGEGDILVPGTTGGSAAGLHIDRWGRLWVAGAGTGTVKVYDAATGAPLASYSFPTTGFLNDLDLVRNTVYVTDSVNQQVVVIPLGGGGALPAQSATKVMPLTGAIDYVDGFNANGLARSGGFFVIVQSNTGLLFRVDPRTGATRMIDTGGYLVSNGDGLEIVGHTLYVVRNFDNLVAVLHLSANLRTAHLLGELTGDLAIPTTATATLGALWVVNARFDTVPDADTPYWITRLPLTP